MIQPLTLLPLVITRGATFGPLEIRAKDATGAAVSLAGWTARAQIRLNPTAPLIKDLTPVIAGDDTEGLITIPEIAWTETDDMPPMGARWDLILTTPEGKRLSPPICGGPVTVEIPITQ